MSGPRRPGSRSRAPQAAAAGAVAVLALGPPLLLAVRSFAGGWYWPALVPRAWSARAWAYVFSPSSEVFSSLVLSVGLAAAVTLLALAAAVPGGRALALCRFRGKRAVLLLLLLPVLAPPVASVMGVHAWFVRLGLADTVAGVLLVHLVPAVPYATLMLMGSFTALDPDREAQARTLGAGPVAVWRAVTLPAIAPGLAVAGAFAFMVSWSQYLTTLFIGGGRVVTLPLALVVFQRGGDEAVTAALSLVFLAPAVAVFLLVSRHLAPHD